jgi:hypothetical protein
MGNSLPTTRNHEDDERTSTERMHDDGQRMKFPPKYITNDEQQDELKQPARKQIPNARPTTAKRKLETDPVIGLLVGGKLFYCNRSTLTNFSGSYFARRFGSESAFATAQPLYTDEQGVDIFFIDRDGDLFGFILEYLRTLKLPPAIGDFYQNKECWKSIRIEAEFYGLVGLVELLQITHSCRFNSFHQGVLYWMGTKKGTQPYQNPYLIQQVHVGGWVDDEEIYPSEHQPISVASQFAWNEAQIAGSIESRAIFVQNQPKLYNIILSEPGILQFHKSVRSRLLWCTHGGQRKPVVVDLISVQVRPTHFSLLLTDCGMDDDWNFEGSKDGINWDVLYKVRNQRFTVPNDAQFETWFNDLKPWVSWSVSENQVSCALQSRLERYNRYTWNVTNACEFYQFFRFIGAGVLGSEGCLHGMGFELYGDVSE